MNEGKAPGPSGVMVDLLKYAGETGIRELKKVFLYWQIPEGDGFWQVVRLGQWKAVVAPGSKEAKLFDLKQDPAESKDVSGDHPEVMSKVLKTN